MFVTVPGKAGEMRFDLRGNGVGDQVDQRCGEVQMNGSVETVLVFGRDAPAGERNAGLTDSKWTG